MNKLKLWIYSLKWLPKRIGYSVVALLKLFYFKPQYTLLAAVISILFYELIFWFLNLGLAQYLLTTPFLTIADKLELIVGSYSGIFTYPFSTLAMTLFLVSVLQGLAIAALSCTIRRDQQDKRSILKGLSGTGVAGIFSVFGLGCAACGTSLVMPILTLLFASSSVALAETVGLYSAYVALIAAVISLYLVGLKLSSKLRV